jgi:Tfp pilus assembly protein PilX
LAAIVSAEKMTERKRMEAHKHRTSLRRDERGVALPVALAILFLVAGLTTIAAKAGVVTNHFTQRDRNAQRALQAANAGIEATIYQLNLMQPKGLECVIKDAATNTLQIVPVDPDGWCITQTEDLGDGASYTARASSGITLNTNGQVLIQRRIVSTGTVNGIKRRVRLTSNAATGRPLFAANYAAISLSSVDFGNSVFINGGIGSNGNITLRNTAEVCGAATPGPGKTLSLQNSATVCPGYSTTAAPTNFVLAPVDQGTSATVNDNSRICVQDTCSGSVSWNAATRTLILTNSGTVTLSGNVYNFCKVEIRNSAQLRIAARTTPLRIFFDTPEACGAPSGNYAQLTLTQTSGIINLNTDPTTLQVMVAGSSSHASSVEFHNTGDAAQDVHMTIYAPNSTILFENPTTMTGALAAKQILLQNSVELTYDERVRGIVSLNSAQLFQLDAGFQECTAVPTSSEPDSGC